jgi:hypothetical protein
LELRDELHLEIEYAEYRILSTAIPTSLYNNGVGGSIGGLPRSYTRPREADATNAPFRLLTSSMLDGVELWLCLAHVCVSNSEQNKLSRESHLNENLRRHAHGRVQLREMNV